MREAVISGEHGQSSRPRRVVAAVCRRLRCIACKQDHKAYGMLRLRRPGGGHALYCFACYERQIADVWRVGDEFWDGDQWVKVEADW
jgi:hypothetical protein